MGRTPPPRERRTWCAESADADMLGSERRRWPWARKAGARPPAAAAAEATLDAGPVRPAAAAAPAVEELEAPAAAEARRPSCELGLGVAWTEAPPKWLL